MIIQSCRSALITVHLKQTIGRVELDRLRWYLREPSHCAYKGKPSLVPFLIGTVVPRRAFWNLQILRATACGFVGILENPSQATVKELFQRPAPKQSKPSHPSESSLSSLRWVVSLFPLPERTDRPSRTNLIFVAKTFVFASGQEVRSLSYNIGRSS